MVHRWKCYGNTQNLISLVAADTLNKTSACEFCDMLKEGISELRKNKATPVTGREGPQGCETSKFPHFLNMDGSEVVSHTHW
jgi:hypothetical protein